jgi:uncharacterized protein (DUF3084 family)
MQPEQAELNWSLIIMIAAISASMSYVGDILGKRIGKKRISILRLRPRHTSTVITIFTGTVVALLTLTLAAYFSESVRISLYGMNVMVREMRDLTYKVRSLQSELEDISLERDASRNELSSIKDEKAETEIEVAKLKAETDTLGKDLASSQRALSSIKGEKAAIEAEVASLRKDTQVLRSGLAASQKELSSIKGEKAAVEIEVARLKRETEVLGRGLAEMKSGRVVVFRGEMLAQTALEPGNDGRYALDDAIGRLIAVSDEYLDGKTADLSSAGVHGRPAVIVTPEMKASVAQRLKSASGRKVLRLTAPSNIVMGQTLEGVVTQFDSNLVFMSGEVLMRELIAGADSPEDGANILYAILKRVNRLAVSKGILPDSSSGAVGNFDILNFSDVVDQIVADNRRQRPTVVTIKAIEDIYTEGPVRVKIEVEEETGI